MDERVIGTIDDPAGDALPWIEVVEDEPDSPYIDIRDPQYGTILQVPRQAVPALIEILQRVKQS